MRPTPTVPKATKGPRSLGNAFKVFTARVAHPPKRG